MIVWKEFRFEAAHKLVESVPPDHKCARLHGHSYRFRVHCEGPVKNGMVIEYSQIPGAAVADELDHQYLNEILDMETTAENLAMWIYEKCWGRCSPAKVVAVEVFETCQTGVVYRGGDA